jgi:hypothetical protein
VAVFKCIFHENKKKILNLRCENIPVFGVTQAQLFLDCESSGDGGDSKPPSETKLLGLKTYCFLLVPALFDRVNLPVDEMR